MEHGSQADAGAEMLRIGRDHRHRARGRPEQEVVDGPLILEGDRCDLGGQCEDDVEIADRQKVALAFGQPVAGRRALTAWAVAVTARVVGDPQMAAVVAALDMATEDGGTAGLDCRHDLQFCQAQMTGAGRPEVWT